MQLVGPASWSYRVFCFFFFLLVHHGSHGLKRTHVLFVLVIHQGSCGFSCICDNDLATIQPHSKYILCPFFFLTLVSLCSQTNSNFICLCLLAELSWIFLWPNLRSIMPLFWVQNPYLLLPALLPMFWGQNIVRYYLMRGYGFLGAGRSLNVITLLSGWR